MKKLLLIVFSVVILIIIVLLWTLISNQANLMKAPGTIARLSVFLAQNTASTSDNHLFPELRTPVFEMDAEQLFKIVRGAGGELGWPVRQVDNDNLKVEFEVITPLLGFSDDVIAQVIFIHPQKSSLYLYSASRTGSVDFAANSGHIQTLLRAVNKSLGW